jgi:hypothetical protein
MEERGGRDGGNGIVGKNKEPRSTDLDEPAFYDSHREKILSSRVRRHAPSM